MRKTEKATIERLGDSIAELVEETGGVWLSFRMWIIRDMRMGSE